MSDDLDSFVVSGPIHEVVIVGPAVDTSFAVARTEAKSEYNLTPSQFAGKWTIDVGAGYGEFTAIAHLSGASRVIAFEPNPFVFKYLNSNVGALPAVEVINAGVFSTSGISILYYRPTGTASGSIHEVQYDPDSALAHTRLEVEVNLLAIGDILERLPGHQRALLKIDAEGSEYEIVAAIATSRKMQLLSTIVVEYHAGIQFLEKALIESGYDVTVEAKSDSMGIIYAQLERIEPNK